MSYILDALKKSEQERQQGTSPHLHSVHGSIPPVKQSSVFKKRLVFWSISGGVFSFICGLGLFFFLHQQSLNETAPRQTIDRPVLSAEPQTSQTKALPEPPAQIIQNNDTSPHSLAEDKSDIQLPDTTKESGSDPAVVIEPKPLPKSLPLLQDLPSELREKIPNLKFAGHTFSKNPSQRMIIINGKILREGSIIASNTHLTEITWEGVTIEFNGILFRVITN